MITTQHTHKRKKEDIARIHSKKNYLFQKINYYLSLNQTPLNGIKFKKIFFLLNISKDIFYA